MIARLLVENVSYNTYPLEDVVTFEHNTFKLGRIYNLGGDLQKRVGVTGGEPVEEVCGLEVCGSVSTLELHQKIVTLRS